MNFYIGQKINLEENVRGRIFELLEDGWAVVREDHRWRVDGSKRRPIYEFARNPKGKIHIVSLEEIKC